MTPATRPAPAAYTVRARSAKILKAAAERGWEGDTEIGHAFGVSRQTAWRILRQNRAPSQVFIAGVLARLPARFEDLFEIVPDD